MLQATFPNQRSLPTGVFVAGLTFPLPQIVLDYFQSVSKITKSSSSLISKNYSGQSTIMEPDFFALDDVAL